MNYLAVVCSHTFFYITKVKVARQESPESSPTSFPSPHCCFFNFYFIPLRSAAISWAAPCWPQSLCSFLQSVKTSVIPSWIRFLRLFTQDRDKLLFPLQFLEASARTRASPRPWQEHTPTSTRTGICVV